MEPITSPQARPAWLPDTVWPYPLGSLTAGARRVAYTDTGGAGPVLLFVHVGLWSLMWRDTIGDLSSRYRCVTLDVPGSGLSDRTTRAEQTLDAAAEAIGVLIDRLDLDRVTLVVHDLGGLAALGSCPHSCGPNRRGGSSQNLRLEAAWRDAAPGTAIHGVGDDPRDWRVHGIHAVGEFDSPWRRPTVGPRDAPGMAERSAGSRVAPPAAPALPRRRAQHGHPAVSRGRPRRAHRPPTDHCLRPVR